MSDDSELNRGEKTWICLLFLFLTPVILGFFGAPVALVMDFMHGLVFGFAGLLGLMITIVIFFKQKNSLGGVPDHWAYDEDSETTPENWDKGAVVKLSVAWSIAAAFFLVGGIALPSYTLLCVGTVAVSIFCILLSALGYILLAEHGKKVNCG